MPRTPIIGWSRPMVKPGNPLSTRNSEMPRAFFSGSVTAETMKKSENAPSLMKCFEPDRRQPRSVRTARVWIEAASDPAPGSVNAIEQTRSPRTAGSSQRWICAPRHSSSTS